MKRLFAVLTIALLLMGLALSVSADPIGVGGTFTSSSSGDKLVPYPGKVLPFEPLLDCTSGPIGVGGT